MEENIQIYTQFIRLQDALKLARLVGSGGEGKLLIQEGQVKVNGQICTMRGKKLYPEDKIMFRNKEFIIVKNV